MDCNSPHKYPMTLYTNIWLKVWTTYCINCDVAFTSAKPCRWGSCSHYIRIRQWLLDVGMRLLSSPSPDTYRAHFERDIGCRWWMIPPQRPTLHLRSSLWRAGTAEAQLDSSRRNEPQQFSRTSLKAERFRDDRTGARPPTKPLVR